MNRYWNTRAILTVGAGFVLGGIAACGSSSSSPDVNPTEPISSPTASASPSLTDPSPPYRDLPEDALAPDHVDWDDVGPGWFLVEFQVAPREERDSSEYENAWTSSDVILLVDPEGTFYSLT
ncbi:MAG: hypothetical protein MUP36_03460, partial [Demequinaceae bacterium]|nr:hypothetical protein [Demequinaceae bacterium]